MSIVDARQIETEVGEFTSVPEARSRIVRVRKLRVEALDPAMTHHHIDALSASHPQFELPKYLRRRYYFDRLVAFMLLLMASPVLIAIAMLVRWTSPGKSIYRQRRVGLGGREFSIYKFRSMRVDAESNSGAVWSQPGDARVTRIGRFLRWSHLDELPQLVNILKGEMALIGPRPERPEFVKDLQRRVPNYRYRLNVLPGVTGLAQVSLPPDSHVGSVFRKTMFDNQYVDRARLGMDVHVLFCTAMLIFGLQRRLCANAWQMMESRPKAEGGSTYPA